YIPQSAEDTNIRCDLADEHEAAIRPGSGEKPDQTQINPVCDKTEESDHRFGEPFHFIRNECLRIASFAKMSDVDAMRNQKRIFVIRFLRLIKAIRRDDYVIRLRHEFSLKLKDRLLIRAGEFRVLVHAMVDDLSLP